MDSIYPWLDAAAVRRLAERLMNPDRQPTMAGTEAGPGLDDGFEGFALSGSPPVTSPLPPPTKGTPELTTVPLAAGVSLFRDWLRENYSVQEIFILDHQGAVIIDENPQGRWRFLAQQAALTSHLTVATAGHLRLKISATAILEIIPVSTESGGRVVGAVVSTPLDAAAVIAVMEALRQMEIA
jgi:hypothetical protein